MPIELSAIRGAYAVVIQIDVNAPVNESETVKPAQEVLKVSAHSRPTAVAGAIAGVIRSHRTADIQAIGAAATNQAIKAVAIAYSYLKADGIQIVAVPSFIDVMVNNDERTAIRLSVEAL
jgi:stage V sporulation protein S